MQKQSFIQNYHKKVDFYVGNIFKALPKVMNLEISITNQIT